MKLTAGALFFDLLRIVFLLVAIILLLDGFFLFFKDNLAFADSAHNFLRRFTDYFRFDFLEKLPDQEDRNIYVWNSLLSGIIFITANFLTEAFQRKIDERKKK